MIRVVCSNCNKTLAVKDVSAGKRGKCPECGGVIQVPPMPPAVADEPDLPDPLVAMASSAASSAASAAGRGVTIVGSAVASLFRKSNFSTSVTESAEKPRWLDVFTRDNQSADVVRAVVDKVNGILMAEEEIQYVAVQNKPILNLSPDCIALTNKRFIFYRPKMLGRVDFQDFIWRELHDAKLSENIVGSTIRITNSYGETFSLDYLPKAQARAVYRIAQQMEEISLQQRRDRSLEDKRAAAGGVLVQTHVATPQTEQIADDPMVKLQKLKKILDANLITQAEYDSKKAHILADM